MPHWSRPRPGPEGFLHGLLSVAPLWLMPLTSMHSEGNGGAAGQTLVQLLLIGQIHLVEGNTEKWGPPRCHGVLCDVEV